MKPPPLLEVTALSVDYALGDRRLQAVDNVGFALPAGATLGVAGASGSGKSTVALAMLGLLDPRSARTRGSIRLGGQELLGGREADWRRLRGRRIGAIFQWPQGSFNPMMSIGQHLREAIRLRFGTSGAALEARALAALSQVGMPRARQVLDSYAFELSGGMCQRAAIALGLSQEPELLIADEPTSALDVISQVEICQLLQQLKVELGISLVVISHDLGLIGQLADRLVVMNQGRVVEQGDLDEVLRQPRHPYTRALLDAARLPAAAQQALRTGT